MNRTCVICGKEITGLDIRYSAYCQRKGGEVTYHVCEKCDRHPKHVLHIIDQLTQKRCRF